MAKKATFVTPRGVAVYPYLTTADHAYNVDGIYKTKLRVQIDEAKGLMDEIKAIANEEFGGKSKTAKLPFTIDNETGTVEFAVKSKFKPKLADSTGSLIPEGKIPNIYGGSILKVAGVLFPYNAGGNIGISLQMGGVQVIELSEGTADYNFESEEGGYVVDQSAANDNEAQNGEAYNF